MARKRTSNEGENSPAFDPAASRVQWLKGVLELCLLGIVVDGEVYGYEILQRLEAAGLGTIKGGTLYPRLAAMEKAGLVEVEWRVGDNGPGRKYYTATPTGEAAFTAALVEYQHFSAAVTELVAGGVEQPERSTTS